MNKQNKLYKILRIIFLTLAIISMVFALCKKVGLCASSGSNTISSIPFPVGAGFGNTFSQEQIISIVSQAQQDCINQHDNGYPSISYICMYELSSNGSFKVNCYYDDPSLSTIGGFNLSSGSSFNNYAFQFSWHNSNGYLGTRRLSFDSDCVLQSGSWYSSGVLNVGASSWVVSSPTGGYMLPTDTYLYGYPIYIANDLSYDNVVFFSNYSGSGSGFDGFGFSEGFNDWVDDNLNPVDVIPPSDQTSTPSWLGKILDGKTGSGTGII